MQAQGNFFYDFDFFVDLIASIATGGKESFCQNCNLLLDCLNDYKKSNKKLEFAKYLEKNIKYKKLNSIDDCKEFIDALKKIPLTCVGWSDRERNMLDLIAIPKQSTKSPPNQHRSNSLSNKPNFNNKQKKTYDSNDISPARRPHLMKESISFSNKPNIQNKNKKSYDSNDISPVRRPHLVEEPQRPIKGLPNIGLSCYMNSALQSLYHDTKFRNAVLKCHPSGEDKDKMNAVKRIFEYLNGDIDISYTDFKNLYKIIGYRGSQEDSLDFKGYIQELFDRAKITNNAYKCHSVLMPWGIPEKLTKDIVSDNSAENIKNDNPSLPEKSIIDINIYRTISENEGKANKTKMDVPTTLTFGKNNYSLVTVNVHHGSSSQSGHYISYIKSGSIWQKINNSYVSTCRWDDIKDDIGRNCTFLRYEKIK